MYGGICGKGKEREVIRQQAARAVREKNGMWLAIFMRSLHSDARS